MYVHTSAAATTTTLDELANNLLASSDPCTDMLRAVLLKKDFSLHEDVKALLLIEK